MYFVCINDFLQRHYDFLSTNNFKKIQILGSIIEHSPHENSTNQAYNNFFENTFDWDLDFNSGSSVIFYVGNDFQRNGTIVTVIVT